MTFTSLRPFTYTQKFKNSFNLLYSLLIDSTFDYSHDVHCVNKSVLQGICINNIAGTAIFNFAHQAAPIQLFYRYWTSYISSTATWSWSFLPEVAFAVPLIYAGLSSSWGSSSTQLGWLQVQMCIGIERGHGIYSIHQTSMLWMYVDWISITM